MRTSTEGTRQKTTHILNYAYSLTKRVETSNSLACQPPLPQFSYDALHQVERVPCWLVLWNTHAFRCFHKAQLTAITRVSKPRLLPLLKDALSTNHQSNQVSCTSGDLTSNPRVFLVYTH
jgi:hypothetical protein